MTVLPQLNSSRNPAELIACQVHDLQLAVTPTKATKRVPPGCGSAQLPELPRVLQIKVRQPKLTARSRGQRPLT